MKIKDFNNRKKEIKAYIESGDLEDAIEASTDLIEELFEDKEFSKIVDIFHSKLIRPKLLFTFEVAYSLVESGFKNEAEEVYEYLLAQEPRNSSVLNNLSNIRKEKGMIEPAFELIQRAYEIEPNDEETGGSHLKN